jgi:hypothetical protein
MIKFSLLKPKTAVSRSNFLRAGAALSSVIVAIGFVGNVAANPLSRDAGSTERVGSPSSEPSFLAQASSDNTMARCSQLFGIWARYNGVSGYSKQVTADMALEDCRKGHYDTGVAELTRVLQRAGITVPPAETAAVR